MKLTDLLTSEDGLGTFKVVETVSDLWRGTVVSVNERTYKGVRGRSVMIVSVKDKRLKARVDQPLPIIVALTSAKFEKV
ncbi:hypothetical protein [Bacillus thuringiensis]|uniref:hypothetical protein n=1 Tax=Bacillus thuringiensis TaxID=1428 RepID=UPI000BFC7D73|nr:hypothetical protein [Bacillus thuringiensis]PGT89835.1 hypothetical protein COD17_08790 [Bacillus thuringiensis]